MVARLTDEERSKRRRESLRRYNNKPETKAKRAEWISQNTDRYVAAKAAHYQRNRDAFLEKAKQFARDNPAWKRAQVQKRRAAIKRATPAWLTESQLKEIKALHKLARDKKKETSCLWEVDHIIPLQGKTVSGLNVPWNIRVVPAEVNWAKGNRL